MKKENGIWVMRLLWTVYFIFITAVCRLPLCAYAKDAACRMPDRPEAAGEGLVGILGSPAGRVAAADTNGMEYRNYLQRVEGIGQISELSDQGFRVIESQVFCIELERFGEVSFIPALDERYHRLVIFLAGEDGSIVYRTQELVTNYRIRGKMMQSTRGIAGVAFQDVNGDGLTDILLITSCVDEGSFPVKRTVRVGDVLFQNGQGFYRDWRLSDEINRFGMNKSLKLMTAFVMDGDSTEFLYTAVTLEELLSHGFEIIPEQCYWREFEKLGRLRVVPGTFRVAGYDMFLIYLVNERGNIVWSFQPMGDYDNLYALRGMTCKDVDGDGMKDLVVLARYSREDDRGGMVVESDYEIYYQRTGGFDTDTGFKATYRCNDTDTVEELVERARAFWGWSVEDGRIDDKDIDRR